MTELRTVLVVDDCGDIRSLFETALRFCEVVALPYGEGTLQKVKKGDFDLLMIDLPGDEGDGFCLVELLRSRSSVTPVIVMSTRLDELHPKLDRLNIPYARRFSKPFQLHEVVSCIKLALVDCPVPGQSADNQLLRPSLPPTSQSRL